MHTKFIRIDSRHTSVSSWCTHIGFTCLAEYVASQKDANTSNTYNGIIR